MPGFTVNTLGADTPVPKNVPYYRYTWEIKNLFESGVDGNSPLIYAKDCTLPNWNFKTEEAEGASLIYKFASSIVWNDIKIVWYDTQGLAEIVQGWRRNIWTPEGGLGLASDYKKSSIIESLTGDGSESVEWLLTGSWPKSVSVGELTYTDSEVKQVEVMLAYDWAEETTIDNTE